MDSLLISSILWDFNDTGIGKETARVLALRGAKVIIACRDQTRGQNAAVEIAQTANVAADMVEVMPLDLSSFESIRAFAAAYLAKDLPIHLLILNAGVMAVDWALTHEGFEMTFGTNHLGHFLLTSLLIEKVKSSAPARIVVVSSTAHNMGDAGVLNVVREEKDYAPWKAYGQSKLANALFALELNRRLQGTNVSANSVHPGVIQTELTRGTTMGTIFYKLGAVFLKSIPQGSATTCFVATHPSITPETSGVYFADSAVAKSSDYAKDANLAAQLWTLSEQLTNTTLLPPSPAQAAAVAASIASAVIQEALTVAE